MDQEKATLNNAVIESMSMGKVFKDFVKRDKNNVKKRSKVNSMDFSEDGKLLVCADDTTLIAFDTINAKKMKTLFNKVNGIKNVRFTHSNEAVICSTKTSPYEIFYWSIHENEIIKTFEGHETPITTLYMNPSDDTFVSVGGEKELKIFDLNSDHSKPLAKLDLSEEDCSLAANFDSSGVVLAVSVYSEKDNKRQNRIDLFDVKKYDEGRFDTWRIDSVDKIHILKFSSNGSYILASTAGSNIVILDAFNGEKKKIFRGFNNELGSRIEASFSPDSRYVITGSEDGCIFVWDVEVGNQVAKLEGHVKSCLHVKFSSHFVVMASACQNVVLWIPKFWG